MGNAGMTVLQISRRLREWKNFENWPTFAKVTNECIVAQFFVSVCVCINSYCTNINTNVKVPIAFRMVSSRDSSSGDCSNRR